MASSQVEENSSYDFEASIQISRILKILTDTIRNAEIVLCLPLALANDCVILRQFFTDEQVAFAQDSTRRASRKESLESGDADADADNGSDFDPQADQADLCLAIDMLLGSNQFVQFCREQLLEEISPGGLALLRNLEELRVCVSERLKVTPKAEARQDAELRRLYQQNIRHREEVERLTERLARLTADTDREIDEKNQLIRQQIEKITKVRRQCHDSVKKRMDEAERQINWDVKNSEYRLEELQVEAKNSQYRKEVQLKEHLQSEKELRAKRYKVESQLVALLQKYDTDIGERQTLLEELTASYEEEKEQLAKLQAQFSEQEAEYVSLMLEKEQYERQQWEAKLYNIQCRIAARRIQRHYRAYVATKIKGKKGKKGKKKK